MAVEVGLNLSAGGPPEKQILEYLPLMLNSVKPLCNLDSRFSFSADETTAEEDISGDGPSANVLPDSQVERRTKLSELGLVDGPVAPDFPVLLIASLTLLNPPMVSKDDGMLC